MRPDTRWIAPGDLNAFFGLITDNMTQLVLCAAFLTGVFGFPADLVLTRMLPGTALGVLVGDAIYAWMGARLTRRTGRPATAMPLGIDTPSLYGVCFVILGPLFKSYAATMPPEAAALRAWHAGMALMVMSGLLKLLLAPFGNAVRRLFPRTALLAPLAGVAVALIAFLPMLEVFDSPIVGMAVLGVVLATLVAGWRVPFGIPGALLAILVGLTLHYSGGAPFPAFDGFRLTPPLPTLGFLAGWRDALPLLPVALPFALATVVGGIDCTESAAAAGDEYDTRAVLAVEGVATLVAGFCGGVIQTTPYIGHPAYKRMGGRSGYALATALFIGVGGTLGLMAFSVALLPKVVLVPVLCFIGLEITVQAFRACEPRHAPASALAFVPCLAYLLLIASPAYHGLVGGDPVRTAAAVRLLGSGFIVTSFLWAAGLAWMIDRRVAAATGIFLLAGVLAACGLIHSPLPDGSVFAPWRGPPESLKIASAYGVLATFIGLLGLAQRKGKEAAA